MRTVRLLTWGPGESSASLKLLKALVFRQEEDEAQSSESVYLQFREVVKALKGEFYGNNQYWHKWYLKNGGSPSWQPFLDKWQMRDTDWIPSIRMAKSWEWTNDTIETFGCEQEVLCSTRFLIAQCLDWSVRLKEPTAGQALLVLSDILTKVLSTQHHILQGEPWIAPLAIDHRCATHEHNGCNTCSSLLDSATTPAGLLVAAMPALLVEAYKHERRCHCCGKWVQDLVCAAVRLLNAGLLCENVWASESKDAPAPRGQKRRMRLDSDLFSNALNSMIGRKRIKTAAAGARCGVVDGSVTSAKRTEMTTMKRYMDVTLRTFQNVDHLRLATDESSVGGEATMVTCVWSASTDTAAWLAPQALS
eukprot:4519091-Amphidinium_carterae.2